METSYDISYIPFASTYSESLGFFYQSDMYYMQEMNSFSSFPGFAGGDFLTFNSGLFRGMGGGEGMDTGDDPSDKDHLFYANDVPVGDGLLPLLLAILVYHLSPHPLHKERELAKRRKRIPCISEKKIIIVNN